MNDLFDNKFIKICIKAAELAGSTILDYYLHRDIECNSKDENDIETNVDQLAGQQIRM